MPSSSPDPLWKPRLLSRFAYSSDGVAWHDPQLNTISGNDTSPSLASLAMSVAAIVVANIEQGRLIDALDEELDGQRSGRDEVGLGS